MLLALLLAATPPIAPAGSAGSETPPASRAARARAASYLREPDYRIARIGYRLGLAGAPFCAEPYPLTGLALHHLAEYDSADRDAAAAEFALDAGPGIVAVVEDSPAAQAGLVAGDIIETVNGRRFPSPTGMTSPADSEQTRVAIEASEAMLEQALRKGPVALTIRRDGREQRLTLDSLPGCPARVRLARSSQLNAFANRGYAIMTTRMLDFTRSDDEVAFILGHEIAHTVLHHPEQLEEQRVPRKGLLRGFGANGAKVRATEIAADRLGIRMAWAAGYDVAAVFPYWQRYQASAGGGPRLFPTHPGRKERERLARELIATLPPRASDDGAQRPELRKGPLGQR